MAGVPEVLEALGVGSGVLALLNFSAGVAAFAGLYGLFAKLEDIASPEAKRDIAAWLKRAEVPGSLTSWPRQFVALFDRVFGKRHLSWRCFLRSSLASLAAVAVTITVWATMRPEATATILELANASTMLTFFAFLLLALMFNVIPDYLSLLESRFALTILANSTSRVVLLIILMLDAVISIMIFLVFLYAVLMFVFGALSPDILSFRSIPRLFLQLMNTLPHYMSLSTEPGSINLGIFLYSSLLTSVWIWLYALSAGAVRLALGIRPVLRVLKWFLEIDGKPIRSIGVVVGLIGAVFWWGLVLIAGPEG